MEMDHITTLSGVCVPGGEDFVHGGTATPALHAEPLPWLWCPRLSLKDLKVNTWFKYAVWWFRPRKCFHYNNWLLPMYQGPFGRTMSTPVDRQTKIRVLAPTSKEKPGKICTKIEQENIEFASLNSQWQMKQKYSQGSSFGFSWSQTVWVFRFRSQIAEAMVHVRGS